MEFRSSAFPPDFADRMAASVEQAREAAASAQASREARARAAAEGGGGGGGGGDGGARGVKRLTRESSSEADLTSRDLHRLEGNALRLRGLLRNMEATPDKRRFSVDLMGQIDTLEKTVAVGKEEQDVQHSDTRARLSSSMAGLSL